MVIKNKNPDLSIIIPVFNEERHIGDIINRVKNLPISKEIIVVDDCSIDSTYDIVCRHRDLKVCRHQRNQGKGAAIRTGLNIASGTYTVIQDADLEYAPEFIPILFSKAKNNNAIYGSRIKGRSTFLFMSYIANRFLSLLTSILYKNYVSDMETCYKMINTDLLKKISLSSNRFDIEPEITAKILRSGFKIIEIPISYRGRKKGKKIGPKDGIIAVWSLIRWRLKK